MAEEKYHKFLAKLGKETSFVPVVSWQPTG